MTVWVFPGGDLHLSRAHGMSMDIRVFLTLRRRGGVWFDATTVPDLHLNWAQVRPDAGVRHAIAPLVGAEGPTQTMTVTSTGANGTSFLQTVFNLQEPGQPMRQLANLDFLRVTTHDDVTALFAGDRGLHVFTGESDRVITVYARFSDGALEDVSGHPFLRYTPVDPTVASVDAEGRVTGLRDSATMVRVALADGRFPVEVPVTVRPPLDGGILPAESAQLTRRTARRRGTVYVLAEGYVDRARFWDHAPRVVRSWSRTKPYRRLADSFQVIAIYQASPDPGITIASRLAPGQAPDRRALWEGGGALPGGIALARDSLFGLMFGTRVSTPVLPVHRPAAGNQAFPVEFVQPGSARSIQPDPRRLARFAVDDPAGVIAVEPPAAFASFVRRYLLAAGHTVEAGDRVAFLVDDDVYGGLKIDVLRQRLDHFPMIALSVGRDTEASGITAIGPLLDRAIRGADLHADLVGSAFAHELAHTYHLGDEYENQRRRVYNADDDSIDEVERQENAQHDRTLRLPLTSPNPLRGDPTVNPALPAGALDVTRIKWNIHRVAKLSAASAIATVPGGLRLTVAPGQAARWRAGEHAFLRNSLAVRRNLRVDRRTTVIAVQVMSAAPAQNAVTVAVPAGTDVAQLGAAPLLYTPRRNKAGQDLALIDPAVLAHLAARGPFPKPPPDPQRSVNAPQDCPPIPGFSRPSHNADAIGLYEGGVDIAQDVFRPAGRCKMRDLSGLQTVQTGPNRTEQRIVIVDFCFVCQYVLVELIDPAQHEGLDGDYPRDC
jgi:hypothetical protein